MTLGVLHRRFVALPLAAALLVGTSRTAHTQADPLADYVRTAIERNLTLRQYRLSAERGRAAVRETRGGFLPSLTLDARYSEMDGALDLGAMINPAYQTLNLLTGVPRFPTDVAVTLPYRQETKLRLVQPLFQPRLYAAHSMSRSLGRADEMALRAATRRLAAEVVTAYLNHARAERVVELYRGTLDLVRENLRVNQRLLDAGTVTPDHVHRARAELSAVEQQLAEAEHQRSSAALAFNLLLDRDLDAAIVPVPDSMLVVPLEVSLDQALRSARERREESAQLDWGVRAADARVRLATASFLPALSLAVDYGIQGADYRFGKDDDVAIASLALQWNLFNGGQDAARRHQARLEAERLRAGRAEVERRIELEVRHAYQAAKVAHRAIATATDRLAAARRTFELVSRRYEAESATLVEFLDARVAYTNAELNLILTRYDYAARRAELERAAALREIEP